MQINENGYARKDIPETAWPVHLRFGEPTSRWAVMTPDTGRGFLFDSEEAARNYMIGMRPDLILERRDPDGTITRLA